MVHTFKTIVFVTENSFQSLMNEIFPERWKLTSSAQRLNIEVKQNTQFEKLTRPKQNVLPDISVEDIKRWLP